VKKLKGEKTCSTFGSDLTANKARLQCKDGQVKLFWEKQLFILRIT
jgi:hypothetical protein